MCLKQILFKTLNSGYFWRRALKCMDKVLWGSLLFILCLPCGWIFHETGSLYFCNTDLRKIILVILVHLCVCVCACSLSEDLVDVRFYLALKHSFLICDYHFKSKKSLNKTKPGFCMRKIRFKRFFMFSFKKAVPFKNYTIGSVLIPHPYMLYVFVRKWISFSDAKWVCYL